MISVTQGGELIIAYECSATQTKLSQTHGGYCSDKLAILIKDILGNFSNQMFLEPTTRRLYTSHTCSKSYLPKYNAWTNTEGRGIFHTA